MSDENSVTVKDVNAQSGEEELKKIQESMYGGNARSRMKWTTLLFRTKGAVIIRVIPHSFAGAILAMALVVLEKSDPESFFVPEMDHPMAVQIFSIILSFVIVARTTVGINRYFGGMDAVHTMSSRWIDSFTSLLGFLRSSSDLHPPGSAKAEACHGLCLAMLHWGSLAHALAINSLQCTQIGFDEKVWEHRIQLLMPPKNLDLRAPQGTGSSSDPQSSRSRAQMVKAAMVGDRRVSLQEDGVGIEKAHSKNKRMLYRLGVYGEVTKEEIVRLHGATDKVAIVLMWMEEAISRAQTQGVLLTAPPILARVYAELGNGMMGFNSAYRIALVPFPFCFAQMIGWCLVTFLFICPVAAKVFTGGEALTTCMTFASLMGFWGMNRIAIEIENPYGCEVNHLPLAEMHHAYVEAVGEMLDHPMPEYSWDAESAPGITCNPSGEVRDLPKLKRNMVQ